ncbi:MAG: class II aldolase/adducin family protein [Candidatus Marinimicrobia bacterium]|nr:class II aldolase/adducin family protein [Candidatus Neomarinimicrobiota bacterium]
MDEVGYIKYQVHFKADVDISADWVIDLNKYRKHMVVLHYIGESPNDNGEMIGFGNISQRATGGFLISATKTGHLETLEAFQYPLVIRCNLGQNWVSFKGKEDFEPSSEAMTHAAIYKVAPDVNAIIHIHDKAMWEKYKDDDSIPSTPYGVEYGTPEMADAVKEIFANTKVRNLGIFVMNGHLEGVVTFGKNLAEADQIIMDHMI